ncbi:MAG: hypothetical protein NC541_01650 [bacterium]|nr:hypothetical protein [bacterium]
MLLANLNRSVKKMKQMAILENAALDAEKKAKNDTDYKTVVGDFSNTVYKLQQTVSVFDYAVSRETVQNLEECIDKLDNIVSSGVVDAEALSGARQQIRKINSNLTKEWREYYRKKTQSSISKLNTLGNLVSDKEIISALRENISNGGEWSGLSLSDDGIHTRLALFKSAIERIDELEESLNLSDEIKGFIVKVTLGKARVTDVTPAIIEWIKKESLDDKFVISFRG